MQERFKLFFIMTLAMSLAVLLMQSCSLGSKDKEPIDTTKEKLAEESPADYYMEQYRNQFHFSPEANWMNDPNGMVYLDGEYHLFYQYYPDSTVWGPMHWAHAVSPDLVHWEHLPIALYPDSLGYIFSGSAVIDKDNTAGFGKGAMVAIYTYHDMEGEQSGTSKTYQYQAIAYSTDKGRTFTKYAGNPVIPNPGIKDFRDPKVIWDVDSGQWVMVFAAHDLVKFYGSPNLKDWTHLSDWGLEYGEHGGIWECPDLFPLTVKETGEKKWVLLQSLNPSAPNGGSGTQYFIGDFDGKTFTLDSDFIGEVTDGKSIWIDYGTDNYAGVTWSNAPVGEDEVLFMGWMSNWQYAQVVPTVKWRSAMTLPRTISLHKEGKKYRLRSQTVPQLKSIEGPGYTIKGGTHVGSTVLTRDSESSLHKIELSIANVKTEAFRLKLSNKAGEYTMVGYDANKAAYFIDRTHSGAVDFEKGFGKVHYSSPAHSGELHNMTIYVDHASVELFADGGRTVMTDVVFPNTPYTEVELVVESGSVEVKSGKVTALKRIW